MPRQVLDLRHDAEPGGRRGDTIDYEIRVLGDVPADVLAELHDARLDPQGVETVLRGPVPDQAALVGIINWLQLIGVELREVRQVGSPDQDPADAPR